MTIKWHPYVQFSRNQFKEILEDNEDITHFDESYIESVAMRRREFKSSNTKLVIFNLVLTAALFLNLVTDKASITFLGLDFADINDVKELVLFVSATISLFIAISAAHIAQLRGLILTWVGTKFSKKEIDFALSPYLMFLDEDGALFGRNGVSNGWHGITVCWGVALAILLFIVAAVIISISLAVHFAVVIDIYSSPSLPGPWWQLILVYVVFVDLSVFAIMFVSRFPLPFVVLNIEK